MTYQSSYAHDFKGLPEVGEIWEWGYRDAKVAHLCVVIEVRWNGEEWWVLSTLPNGGAAHWNDASNFTDQARRHEKDGS